MDYSSKKMADSSSSSRRCSIITPDSNKSARRCLYDSGYQSNTPNSIGLERNYERSITLNVPEDGSLYTPELMGLKTRITGTGMSKCMVLKHNPFPISTEETQFIDYISDSHNLDENMSVDDDDDFLGDDAMSYSRPTGNSMETDSIYPSLYEPIVKTSTKPYSMDVEVDTTPTPSTCFNLNTLDNKYNDQVLEANIRSRRGSLSLSTDSGKQLLAHRLGIIQQERSGTETPVYHNWRDQLTENGYKILKDFSGKSNVDFLYYLGKKSNHSPVISKILNNLLPEDLRSVAKVSKIWQNIVLSDKKSQKRLLDFTKPSALKHDENTKRSVKKMDENLNSGNSSRERAASFSSGPFIRIENYQPAKTVATPARSPPVTPSKFRFHSFYKAGCKLKRGDRQTTCPRCSKPAEVNVDSNTGTCMNTSCVHKFCSVCRRAIHSASPCMVLSSPQAKKSKSMLSVGSKQSKRNLRRL